MHASLPPMVTTTEVDDSIPTPQRKRNIIRFLRRNNILSCRLDTRLQPSPHTGIPALANVLLSLEYIFNYPRQLLLQPFLQNVNRLKPACRGSKAYVSCKKLQFCYTNLSIIWGDFAKQPKRLPRGVKSHHPFLGGSTWKIRFWDPA